MSKSHTTACGLTGVAIWIQIPDLDGHQNLITCSLPHCQPPLKFLCKVANTQTNDKTISSLLQIINIVFY